MNTTLPVSLLYFVIFIYNNLLQEKKHKNKYSLKKDDGKIEHQGYRNDLKKINSPK